VHISLDKPLVHLRLLLIKIECGLARTTASADIQSSYLDEFCGSGEVLEHSLYLNLVGSDVKCQFGSDAVNRNPFSFRVGNEIRQSLNLRRVVIEPGFGKEYLGIGIGVLFNHTDGGGRIILT